MEKETFLYQYKIMFLLFHPPDVILPPFKVAKVSYHLMNSYFQHSLCNKFYDWMCDYNVQKLREIAVQNHEKYNMVPDQSKDTVWNVA